MPSLGETVLANAACAAGLALLALIVGQVCRRPALRHGLWLLVLLKLVTPPLFSLPLRVLPAEPALVVTAAPPAAPEPPPEPLVSGQFLVLPSANDGEILLGVKIITEAVPPQEKPTAAPAPPAVDLPAATTGIDRASIGRGLVAVWVAGALAWFFVFALRTIRFRTLLRFARPAPAELQVRAAALAGRLGLAHCPEVQLVPGPVSPMVWMAVGRPRVYLPAELLDRLDATERDTLLAHELAHLCRRDNWVRWLEVVVQGAYWWYPLVPLARRQIQLHEEECCDALVTDLLPARSYASAIIRTLDFLAGDVGPLPATASGLGRVATLKRRLTRIMRGGVPGTLGLASRLALATVALGLLPLLPTLAKSSQPPAERASESLAFLDSSDAVDAPDGADESSEAPTSAAPRALAHAPGGQLAVALEDHTVEIRESAGGSVVMVLRGHTGPVNCLAYSPDGKTLATGSSDRTVRLWDPATGDCRATLRGHGNWVYALAFASDGATLASAGYDCTIRLWNPQTGRGVATLKGHTAAVRALAFSSDGKTVASGGGDQTIRLWDVASRRARATLTGHNDTIRALAFSPGDRLLASAGDDGTARLWDPRTGRLRSTLTGHNGEVTSLAFAPWGPFLITGGMDRTVRLWNTATGAGVVGPPGHRDGVIAVACAPQTGALTSLSQDGKVRELRLARVSLRLRQVESVNGQTMALLPKGAETRKLFAFRETKTPGKLPPEDEPARLIVIEILRVP